MISKDQIKFRKRMITLLDILLKTMPKYYSEHLSVHEEYGEIQSRNPNLFLNCKISCSPNERTDLIIVYSFKSKQKDYKIPILIGELKSKTLKNHYEQKCYQLLYYQLAAQRPLFESSSSNDPSVRCLLGFVMDHKEAYII